MASEKVKELVNQYFAIKEEINLKVKQSASVVSSIAEELSPVKIGELVTVNGYSYKGKTMGVYRIFATIDNYRNVTVKITAVGKVIKKDGEEGLQDAENFYHYTIE